MNKRVLLISGLIITLAISAIGFLLINSGAQQDVQTTADASNNGSSKPKDETPAPSKVANANASQPGKYIDYSEDALASTNGTKLIFFHAPWCPQCRDLEASIKGQGVPDDVTILKADYDTSQQLRQKYGVTIQTTVVRVDQQGNLIKKYVAYNEPTIGAVIKNLL